MIGRLQALGVVASWRWRRFVVRRARLLVVVSLGLSVLGWHFAPSLYSAWRGSVFSGRSVVSGQIVVRPVPFGGVVRDSRVRLVPLPAAPALAPRLIGVFFPPRALDVPVDFAGRWRIGWVFPPLLTPGWPYSVVVQAEGCVMHPAGVVVPAWFTVRRRDSPMTSCRPERRR